MEFEPPTYISELDFSDEVVDFFTGGGGAGRVFLCRCLIVPVELLTDCVEGEGISADN